MRITRDVIRDLLPSYLSGEASPDTLSLVEEFLKTDPELAQLVKQADEPLRAPPVQGAFSEDAAMASLRRVRRSLLLKTWSLGAAIFFTLSLFSFRFSTEGGVQPLVASSPLAVTAFAILALSSGGAYWVLRRRLG